MTTGKHIYNRLVLLIIAAVSIVLFWQARSLFFFDEDVFITDVNSVFMQQAWERSFILKQLLKLQHYFFGRDPAGYHMVSIVLHTVNIAVSFILCRQLFTLTGITAEQEGRSLYSVFLLLFLLSPAHSEPLSYILAQGVITFTLFSLLCLIFFIRGIYKSQYNIFISLFFFALTLLCYEISWMIPCIIFSIAWFKNNGTEKQFRSSLVLMLPYIALLAVWLLVKNFLISKSLVADYGNVSFANIDVVKIIRNAIVLFVRNFVPPFQSTGLFIAVAAAFLAVLAVALVKLFRKDRKVFLSAVLLLLLTVFSFLPATLFGIDSHDSESERYVYFSSLFAMMLAALLVNRLISNTVIRAATAAAVCVIYVLVLFTAINNYREGGRFSKIYLYQLNQYSAGFKTVYTVNQPSQFKGALLLRALTRLPERVGDNYTVLNEYMRYLYKNSKTAFVTFSAVELSRPPQSLKTLQYSLDSSAMFFPETVQLTSGPGFERNNVMIAALRNDSLYIFR